MGTLAAWLPSTQALTSMVTLRGDHPKTLNSQNANKMGTLGTSNLDSTPTSLHSSSLVMSASEQGHPHSC